MVSFTFRLICPWKSPGTHWVCTGAAGAITRPVYNQIRRLPTDFENIQQPTPTCSPSITRILKMSLIREDSERNKGSIRMSVIVLWYSGLGKLEQQLNVKVNHVGVHESSCNCCVYVAWFTFESWHTDSFESPHSFVRTKGQQQPSPSLPEPRYISQQD